jgi:tRNA threonylcarbamoyladenosine biosynthesis protein TsaB
MRILAIETATAQGSVALLEDDRPAAQVAEAVPQRHLEWLAPAIDRLLRTVAWRPADVEAVAVSRGPGGFTGLRIGVATALAWARALEIPLAAVSTLEALAAGTAARGLVCPVLDARRGEVAGALFERDGATARLLDDRVAPVDALLAALPAGRPVLFVGDAVARHADVLARHPQATFAPPDQWAPRAAAVGAVAWRRLRRGERDDLYHVTPVYARGAALAAGPR